MMRTSVSVMLASKVLIKFALPGMAPRVLISSFRDGPAELGFTRVSAISLSKSATADLDGPDPESRDSPMCNSTSEVRAGARPGMIMTFSRLLGEDAGVITASSDDLVFGRRIARHVAICSIGRPRHAPCRNPPAAGARRAQAGVCMTLADPSVVTDQPSASRNWQVLMVYTAAIFVSALLLFSVQPLFTKMVLPRLGGSPAVWSVAMVFFQSLLQAWFVRTGHPNGPDPYFLYASSNIGSFLALLSYPVLLEPMFTLRTQNLLWAGGYGLLIVLIGACGLLLLRSPANAAALNMPDDDSDAPAPSWMLRARWIFLAAVPSGLLIAVTAHISTDVAAAPLLWVLPLSLYL